MTLQINLFFVGSSQSRDSLSRDIFILMQWREQRKREKSAPNMKDRVFTIYFWLLFKGIRISKKVVILYILEQTLTT